MKKKKERARIGPEIRRDEVWILIPLVIVERGNIKHRTFMMFYITYCNNIRRIYQIFLYMQICILYVLLYLKRYLFLVFQLRVLFSYTVWGI